MKRFTKKEINNINKLIKNGKSLRQIGNIIQRSKSTIYYHYKKINGKKFKSISLENLTDCFLGEFLGLFAGDGNYFFDKKSYGYNLRFFFNINEKIYVEELSQHFHKMFKKKPGTYFYPKKSIIILGYKSKALHNLLVKNLNWKASQKKTYTIHLKEKYRSKEFKIGFLRGSIDSDGHLSKNKISFASTSKKLMNNIESFLIDLNFRNYKRYKYEDKRKNRVKIHLLQLNRPERKKFLNLIKPRNTVLLKRENKI
ncbi:MAG: LAGLIDADG family homing endonuclease [Nanoarchaeota archaeon]|nr:LAGLIDADG family homing endonuclease [Nanoarchaeota archaeon]